MKYCSHCGKQIEDSASFCQFCGAPQNVTPSAPTVEKSTTPVVTETKSRTTAGILAILLGTLGIHKFYLGYTKEGIIMLLCSVIGAIFIGLGPAVMEVIALIEGVTYLTKSDEEFKAIYVDNRKSWF